MGAQRAQSAQRKQWEAREPRDVHGSEGCLEGLGMHGGHRATAGCKRVHVNSEDLENLGSQEMLGPQVAQGCKRAQGS